MVSKVTIVDWRDLSVDQLTALQALRISDRQVTYAGTIEGMIDQCRSDMPTQVRGFAVVAAGTVAGFFQLKRPPASPDWVPADTATLHGLMIDTAHQGKGLGRAAFAAAMGAVSPIWPDIRRFALSVDADNAAALSLYLSFGMNDSGPIHPGRIGMEHRLELDLAGANRL